MSKKIKMILGISIMVILILTVTLLIMFLPRSAKQLGLLEKFEDEIVSIDVGGDPAKPELWNLSLKDTVALKEMTDILATWNYSRRYTYRNSGYNFLAVNVETASGGYGFDLVDNNRFWINGKVYQLTEEQAKIVDRYTFRIYRQALLENGYDEDGKPLTESMM